MANYFDPTNSNDLAYLPPRYRDADDLAFLAPEVENDVIEYYVTAVDPLIRGWYASPYRAATQAATNSNRWIFLRGFKVDAADPLVDPLFLIAMKRTIALVLRWRLEQLRMNMLSASEAGNSTGRNVVYRMAALDPFPPSWNRFLDSFDTRERY